MEEDLDGIFHTTDVGTPIEEESCIHRKKVILHFDIDCFYAQVEMLKGNFTRNR